MLGLDFSQDKYYHFLRLHGLSKLADFLFGDLYCFPRETLLNQLCYLHSEFELLKDGIIEELRVTYQKLDEKKAKEILTTALSAITNRKVLIERSASENPIPKYEEPESITESKVEMRYSLEEGDIDYTDIAHIHSLIVDNRLANESDGAFRNIDLSLGIIPGSMFQFFETYKLIYQHTFFDFHLEYLDQIQEYIELINPEKPLQPERAADYGNFKDLFYNTDEIDSVIAILREYEPSIINNSNKFIRRRGNKARLVGFYEALVKVSKINEVSRETAAKLFSDFFETSISPRFFQKHSELVTQSKRDFIIQLKSID